MRPSARRGLRTESETRNVRSKCRCSCVLQFTCRRAFSGVLHRPTCQVIHRSGLYFCFGVALPARGSRAPSRHLWVWYCLRDGLRGELHLKPGASRPVTGTSTLAERTRRRAALPGSGGALREESTAAPGAHGSGTTGRDRSSGALTVMILPQVHLRKPCYDFYFL
jgi:hypothetical protein